MNIQHSTPCNCHLCNPPREDQTFEIVECESKVERYLELLQRCETVLTRAMDRASIRDGRALLDDLREELGK